MFQPRPAASNLPGRSISKVVDQIGKSVWDSLQAISGIIAAAGATAALILSFRALQVSARTAASEAMFPACGELIAACQRIERIADELADEGAAGEKRSRSATRGAYDSFNAARARLELATTALGTYGPRTAFALDCANTFILSVVQADTDADILRRRLAERSWFVEDDGASSPHDPTNPYLHHSVSYATVFGTMKNLEGESAYAKDLTRLNKWWSEQIRARSSVDRHNVYSPTAAHLTQNARLISDYTREWIEPLCQQLIEAPSRRLLRSAQPVT